ncbi:MAG: hypothetical protein HYR76_01925 [Ignavibacteria bacterium]|nr:hypothetical protein [Ignavibacteria bacterium]
MKQNISVVILALLLSSCAASVPYATDYPLTHELFHSRDGMFSGKIPQGWFSTTSDSLAPAVVVSMIKNDFSAVLSVKELKLDRLAAERVAKDGYALLAHLSMGLQDEGSTGGETIDPKEFEVHGRKYGSYEIISGGVWKRIVVFSLRGRFYECESYTVKGNWSADALSRLFSVQQSVLASLSM